MAGTDSGARQFLGDDMRVISDFQVVLKNGGLVVRAEARDPYSSSGDRED